MTGKFHYLLVILIAALFIQCNRKPLNTNPEVKNLTDYLSEDGEIHLNVSGGKAPYSFSWSDMSTDSVMTSLSAGTYMVTITDAKGRELVDTIDVTQPPWPVCIDMDGNSYKTVIVGEQIWMAENIRSIFTPAGDSVKCYTYGNDESLAEKYGRLYTWKQVMCDSVNEGAQGICPDGWHVPTDEEWSILVDNISNSDKDIPDVKKALDLQYAGFYNEQFQNLDMSVSFWTSTEARNNVWKRYFNKNLSKAFRYHENKDNAISLRCIKNK